MTQKIGQRRNGLWLARRGRFSRRVAERKQQAGPEWFHRRRLHLGDVFAHVGERRDAMPEHAKTPGLRNRDGEFRPRLLAHRRVEDRRLDAEEIAQACLQHVFRGAARLPCLPQLDRVPALESTIVPDRPHGDDI